MIQLREKVDCLRHAIQGMKKLIHCVSSSCVSHTELTNQRVFIGQGLNFSDKVKFCNQ